MKGMKTIFQIFLWAALVAASGKTVAQKLDEERMERDIEVAENVLTTLIKQQFSTQRMFFPLEIKGHYQAGYGITFTLPADYTTPIAFTITDGNNGGVVVGNDGRTAQPFFYRYEIEEESAGQSSNTISLKNNAKERRKLDMDSIRNASNLKVIDAAKTFIMDYGDMLTQLGAQEKIVITNQGNQPRAWVNHYFNASKRSHLSIEMLKSDLQQLKSGKLSREEALSKIQVVNTETIDAVEPDLELLASMMNRLYRPDLSKTYFSENYVYYERLKDFGVIYYMQVFSNYERDYQRYYMPTVGLDNIDLETRNKKVTELYPKFEQDLKENMLEYGRTLKSLKDDEVLVFQIKMTKCPECGIPSSLECAVKGSVLKDFSAGKIDKHNALNKIAVKRGAKQ